MSMIGNYRCLSPQKLKELLANSEKVADFLDEKGGLFSKPVRLDIDKAWHGIHFLLTGSAWEGEAPLRNAVLGGVEVGGDVGYGAARYITAQEVLDVSTALSRISRDELLSRLNLQRMKDEEIYPDAWEDEAMEREYLGEHYERLVVFFTKAAKSGDAVLKYLN